MLSKNLVNDNKIKHGRSNAVVLYSRFVVYLVIEFTTVISHGNGCLKLFKFEFNAQTLLLQHITTNILRGAVVSSSIFLRI